MLPRKSWSDNAKLLTAVGARLREARKAAGLTQTEAADALRVTSESIGRWERGQNEPGLSQTAHLAELYGVSLDWLVGKATHQSGLRLGATIVDDDCVSAIRAAAKSGGSLHDVARFMASPALQYAWEVPDQPRVIGSPQVRELHLEMAEAIRKLEGNTE